MLLDRRARRRRRRGAGAHADPGSCVLVKFARWVLWRVAKRADDLGHGVQNRRRCGAVHDGVAFAPREMQRLRRPVRMGPVIIPFEQRIDRNAESTGDMIEDPGRFAVGPFLIFLELLVAHAEP